MNSLAFQEFISQTSLVMNRTDQDLSYLAAYVLPRDVEYLYVKEKSLVRFQFLEILLRMAYD
jgi:hypothetical protein